jgi:hypothetical protein
MIAVALGVAAPASGTPTFEQWSMWIADAEMLIEARRVALDVTGPLDPDVVDYVVRESVVAHARRPDSATQVTTSVDDGSVSKIYSSSRGRMVILDDLWPMLGLTEPKGAFSIDLAPTSTIHLPWCAINLGALYCSCGADIAGEPIFELG